MLGNSLLSIDLYCVEKQKAVPSIQHVFVEMAKTTFLEMTISFLPFYNSKFWNLKFLNLNL